MACAGKKWSLTEDTLSVPIILITTTTLSISPLTTKAQESHDTQRSRTALTESHDTQLPLTIWLLQVSKVLHKIHAYPDEATSAQQVGLEQLKVFINGHCLDDVIHKYTCTRVCTEQEKGSGLLVRGERRG